MEWAPPGGTTACMCVCMRAYAAATQFSYSMVVDLHITTYNNRYNSYKFGQFTATTHDIRHHPYICKTYTAS